MRQPLLLIFLLCFYCSGLAQDFLVPLGSNPALFNESNYFDNANKLLVSEDSFVYQYDTLSLPFIDDFSTDHFPKKIKNTSDPRVKDTLLYQIYENGVPYRNQQGFVKDTTATFTLDTSGAIVSAIVHLTTPIDFYDLSSFPPKKQVLNVFPPYNDYDSANGKSDTVFLTPDYFSDSAHFYIVSSKKNDYYTNRSAYLNNTFGLNPPSIGVVTFDGLNENGLPYDFMNPRSVTADKMSSVPIDLGNLPDSDVFFSFFYQRKGLSLDGPDQGDTLALDFFDASAQKWINVWRLSSLQNNDFTQKIIRVPDSLQKTGFRFRFRNYANSTGGFDQWHIDYLYLNNGRSINDTAYLDISYVYDAPSLLKDYTAMPWFHFKLNPALYMTDTARTLVVNNSSLSLTVYNKMVIPDTVQNTEFYRYPATDKFVFLPAKRQTDFRYPVSFSYSPTDVVGPGVFEATYDIDFRPSMSQPQDFIRSNDTVIGKTVLNNYYAYDDGTAEAGYGIVPLKGGVRSAYMAVEFNSPVVDTIGGVRIYFFPQAFDIQNQKIELTVWNSLSPPNVIFKMPILYNPQYTDINGYLTYNFDSLVEVNQTFYVGFKSIGPKPLNVGYDLNRDNRSKIHWSQNGLFWESPSKSIRGGSLMMRPIFKVTGLGVGIKEPYNEKLEITIFPNPTRGTLNISQTREQKLKEMLLMDINGKTLMHKQYQKSIDLSSFSPGIYFLRVVSKNNQVVTKKIVVSP